MDDCSSDRPSLHLRPHGSPEISRSPLVVDLVQHHAKINGIFVQRNERQRHRGAAQSGRGLFERRPVEAGGRVVRRAILFPKAILRAEAALDAPLRKALGLKRASKHKPSTV
jgi:hypothetical protein